jgi:hypothetical protein
MSHEKELRGEIWVLEKDRYISHEGAPLCGLDTHSYLINMDPQLSKCTLLIDIGPWVIFIWPILISLVGRVNLDIFRVIPSKKWWRGAGYPHPA